MPHKKNQLLARLSSAEMDIVVPELGVVWIERDEVLAQSHQRIENVYFPHSGILSFVVDLQDGEGIETGMVGRDGVFGAAQALDDKVSLNKVSVQVRAPLPESAPVV